MISICTFASGSSGNCMLLRGDNTNILIDAGISARRICASLAASGLSASDIDAILVTHEHSDHISALPVFLKKFPMEIYGSSGTLSLLGYTVQEQSLLCPFSPGESFRVGSCLIESFRTSHDAAESVGYRIECGGSVGILTDTGYVTDEAADALLGSSLLVLEANHDVECLESGPYPYPLKRRILGDRGHLSNGDAAEFALKCAESGTQDIVLAHLSDKNNTPSMALSAVRHKLDIHGYPGVDVSVAPRSVPGEIHIAREKTSCRK